MPEAEPRALEPSGWIRNRTLVAGLGSAFLALLSLIALPLWAAPAVAAGGFLALRWHFSPRGLFGGIGRAERPRVELVREVLGAAVHDLSALVAAGQAIRDPEVARRVRRMAGTCNDLCRQLERRPQRLLRVQRLLTFYLPSARRLAESYPALESRRLDALGHAVETRDMLARLETLFDDYARKLQDPQRDALDVELRLLEQSLEEERVR